MRRARVRRWASCGDGQWPFIPGNLYVGQVLTSNLRVCSARDAGIVQKENSFTILLNNPSPGVSFVSGNVNDWATTILHELGHAVYDLYGSYASKITPDGNDTALSEANTRLVKEKCKL